MRLIDYFLSNTERPMIHKPVNYFDTYEKYFSRYIGTKCKILEIGVENGGSLQMWKQYFGDDCEVVGIDINPLCKEFTSDGIRIYIGDQMNDTFLNEVLKNEHHFDIIIDDGGHHSIQQIRAFSFLYDRGLSHTGIYLVEDIGTSYMSEYGGGLGKPDTFIEYCKGFIDKMNFSPSFIEFAKVTKSISFHAGIIVFERGHIESFETLAIGVKRV